MPRADCCLLPQAHRAICEWSLNCLPPLVSDYRRACDLLGFRGPRSRIRSSRDLKQTSLWGLTKYCAQPSTRKKLILSSSRIHASFILRSSQFSMLACSNLVVMLLGLAPSLLLQGCGGGVKPGVCATWFNTHRAH